MAKNEYPYCLYILSLKDKIPVDWFESYNNAKQFAELCEISEGSYLIEPTEMGQICIYWFNGDMCSIDNAICDNNECSPKCTKRENFEEGV